MHTHKIFVLLFLTSPSPRVERGKGFLECQVPPSRDLRLQLDLESHVRRYEPCGSYRRIPVFGGEKTKNFNLVHLMIINLLLRGAGNSLHLIIDFFSHTCFWLDLKCVCIHTNPPLIKGDFPSFKSLLLPFSKGGGCKQLYAPLSKLINFVTMDSLAGFILTSSRGKGFTLKGSQPRPTNSSEAQKSYCVMLHCQHN
jgi:hypothetical protein